MYRYKFLYQISDDITEVMLDSNSDSVPLSVYLSLALSRFFVEVAADFYFKKGL